MLKTFDGYKRFGEQILRLAEGERLLLGVSIVLTIFASITEVIGFGLLIPIVQSAQNLAGFDGIPLLGWFAGLFAGMGQNEKLMYAAGALMVLTLMRGCLIYVSEIASYSLLPRVESRVKMRVFENVYKMPISAVEGMPAGELSNLTGTNPARVALIIRFVQLLCANGVIVVINAIFMAIISPLVTLCMVLVMGALTFLYKKLSGSALRDAGQKLTQASSDFSQLFYNTINGMRLIKLSNGASEARQQIDEAVADLKHANLKRLSIEATVFPFFATSIGVLFCLVLIGSAAMQLGNNAELLAILVATIYLMSRLMGPVTLINVARTNIVANMDALDHLDLFLQSAPTMREKDGNVELERFGQDICFEDVEFQYPGQDLPALASFNLRIRKGEKIGLVGLSGSGKSTVVALLCRIFNPAYGRVLIDGRDIQTVRIESWWRQIAVVMQDMVLMRSTIRASLTQGLSKTPMDDEIWGALETADIRDVVEALPNGLDTVLADRGVGLSGGERQRLSLARALLRKPELLILDEATSNLDVQTEARIVDRLADRCRNLTVLVVAHRIGALRACDKLVVIRGGVAAMEISRNPVLPTGYPSLMELLPTDEH